MIFNDLPMQVLIDLFIDVSKQIPIYKQLMSEDNNTIPNSYMVIKTDVNNSSKLYGDGESLVRQSDCEIALISKGFANKTDCLHEENIALIKGILKSSGIDYVGMNLGYYKEDQSTHYVFSFGVQYIG